MATTADTAVIEVRVNGLGWFDAHLGDSVTAIIVDTLAASGERTCQFAGQTYRIRSIA
jgi:hypothetical protein